MKKYIGTKEVSATPAIENGMVRKVMHNKFIMD